MHSLSHNKVLYRLSLSAILIAAMSFVSSYILPSTTSALTYSSDTDISFTFNPTLSISISNANINIDNLLPGLSSESSPITVHVNSNTPYGYSLFASVGNSTDYNTTSLVHKSNDNSNNNSSNDNNNSNNNNNSIPATFTSIATNASLPQLDTDNTWGYSFSNDNGTTWSNYNGLPLYSTVGNNTSTNNPALLIDTKSPADSTESIDFKIAAKASTTQASGTYNNVINFYAVGKPAPLTINDITYLQEFAYDPDSIKASMPEHVVYTLKDIRDDREYTVAKLKDGKVWMTQNLDLAGGTKLYSETSDVPEGYPESGNSPYYTLPASSDSGWSSDDTDYVYNTPYSQTGRTNCGYGHPCFSYYSWIAATALSGKGIVVGNVDAPYSICPKGWKLPTGRTDSSSDFYQLVISYGATPGTDHDPSFYNLAGPKTIPNLLLAGWYEGRKGFVNGGWGGYYWSSTSSAFSPGFYGNAFFFRIGYTGNGGVRRSNGQPIRCLAY